ncbi:MAG: hypothetical protein CMJ39_03580 [Phycisphaerae bacterium]|nr:hypothetical protein [Phycisphaerae bacterium]|tara:strand:- start:1487 stop:1867 length:381 start_codon:yes stop_codon:yes gene_type:complete
MQDYIAGIIVGIIILQTAVFAPTIFTTIDAAPAGKLLRALFPKFFKLLIVLGIFCTAALIFGEKSSVMQYIIAVATILLPLICAVLVPITNKATDAGNRSRFKLLHTISVVLTMLVLVGNLAFPWI